MRSRSARSVRAVAGRSRRRPIPPRASRRWWDDPVGARTSSRYRVAPGGGRARARRRLVAVVVPDVHPRPRAPPLRCWTEAGLAPEIHGDGSRSVFDRPVFREAAEPARSGSAVLRRGPVRSARNGNLPTTGMGPGARARLVPPIGKVRITGVKPCRPVDYTSAPARRLTTSVPVTWRAGTKRDVAARGDLRSDLGRCGASSER